MLRELPARLGLARARYIRGLRPGQRWSTGSGSATGAWAFGFGRERGRPGAMTNPAPGSTAEPVTSPGGGEQPGGGLLQRRSSPPPAGGDEPAGAGRHRGYGLFGFGWPRIPAVRWRGVGPCCSSRWRCGSSRPAHRGARRGGAADRGDPEIAPVLTDIAADWMATDPKVDGQCVNATVEAVLPHDRPAPDGVAGKGIDIAAVPGADPGPELAPGGLDPRLDGLGEAGGDDQQPVFGVRAGVDRELPHRARHAGGRGEVGRGPGRRAADDQPSRPSWPPARSSSASRAPGGTPPGWWRRCCWPTPSPPPTTNCRPSRPTLRGGVKTSSTGELRRTFSARMNGGTASGALPCWRSTPGNRRPSSPR